MELEPSPAECTFCWKCGKLCNWAIVKVHHFDGKTGEPVYKVRAVCPKRGVKVFSNHIKEDFLMSLSECKKRNLWHLDPPDLAYDKGIVSQTVTKLCGCVADEYQTLILCQDHSALQRRKEA